MANFFGEEDAVMRALAKVEDFDPHDLRRTASTWANATCPGPWVDRLLDHEIGGVAGTYNRHDYIEQNVSLDASNWPPPMARSMARAGVEVVESSPLIRTLVSRTTRSRVIAG